VSVTQLGAGAGADVARGEEREELRHQLRRLAERYWGDQRIREFGDGGTAETRQALDVLERDMGLSGMLVPEEYGGLGGGAVEAAIAAEELGAAMIPSNLLGACTAAALLEYAPESLRRDVLPLVVGRGSRTAVGWPGDDHTWSVWEAGLMRLVGGSISGTAAYVPEAEGATVLILPVVAGERVGVAVVGEGREGLVVSPVTSPDVTRLVATLSGSVPAEGFVPLAEGAVGFALTIGLASVVLAAEMVGASRSCLERTVEYTKSRKAFGRPIATFQVLKHRIVDVLVALEAARAITDRAAREIDDQRAAGVADERELRSLLSLARMAKARASDALQLASHECIQMHGGIGFTWDNPAHFYLKKWASSSRLYGQPDELRLHIYQDAITDIQP
jgi:alkylation response protein AidB-like acyl-CoA dehydrogenase